MAENHTKPEICEIPHASLAEEEACETRRLTPVPANFDDILQETDEQIELRRAYEFLPTRYAMSLPGTHPRVSYPFRDTDGTTVIAPEAVVSEDGGTIAYRGQDFKRVDPVPGADRHLQPAISDMFRRMFGSQDKFQRLLGHNYADMETAERVGYLKDQILALTDEAHEALNEIGWKPWATSRHINREEFAGELADILCFLINLALGVGLSADDFFRLHQEKALRNIKRQEAKYDGVSGKCPGCKRAIDDLRVKGLPIGTFGGVDYCSADCIEKANPSHFAPLNAPR